MLPSLLFLAERRFLRLVASCTLVLGAVACSSSKKEDVTPENLITKNDFESMEGWGVVSSSLTTAKAHSGRYSVKVDPETEYSIGYTNNLIRVSDRKINKIHVHGWVLLSGPKAKAVMVVQITDPAKGGPPIYWEAMNIRAEVKTLNHWTEIDKDFDLPSTINSNQELKVYMWRNGPEQTTYLDDLEITKG
ncbi:carbohydrate binding domain-containing protein [Hymenobacter sp. B1770]|uniref:carbohydrate binding domain-containing protein n=1 Tax=Hymenobacter sp. B1770 TaxID=1718788 RepID=UPI003CF16CBF